MKRWIGSLALALVAGAAIAQAPFTIVRPLDGAHVRETIRVEIPKGSIPENGYIGVFLDGKFIEAVRPPVKGKYFEYDLDTQARGIEDSPDGKPYKLEVVLFTTYNDQPRIVDRSSVDVFVANKSSIAVPNKGFSLRYRWTPGTNLIYDCTTRHVEDEISQTDANTAGAIPAQMENAIPEHTRMLYAIDRQFPDADGKIRADSDGLIRMEAIPEKGLDYILATDQGASEPEKHYAVDVAPLYMRLTTTGREIWGSIPDLSNSTIVTGHQGEHYFADLPLPTLPVNNVRPGDTWRSRFQSQVQNLVQDYVTRNKLVETYPALGEFVGVEWEMGHPCAMLKDSISESETSEEAKALAASNPEVTANKIDKETETLWFSLDTHKLLRMDRDIVTEGESTAPMGGALGGAPGMGPGGYGAPGKGPGRGPGMGPGFPGGGKRNDDLLPPTNLMQRMPGLPGGGGRPGRPGMGPGGPGGPGGYPGMPGSGGGQAAQKTIVRMTFHTTRILEQ